MLWSVPLIAVLCIGIGGFILKNAAELPSIRIIGALMMGPAFAWLTAAVLDTVVPRVGWGVWVFVIGILGFVLSGGKLGLTVFYFLLFAAYPFINTYIPRLAAQSGVRLSFGGPNMPTLIVIALLFWLGSLWDAASED